MNKIVQIFLIKLYKLYSPTTSKADFVIIIDFNALNVLRNMLAGIP